MASPLRPIAWLTAFAVVDLPLAIPHTVVGIALLFVFGRTGIVGATFEALLGIQFWGALGAPVVASIKATAVHLISQ